MSTEDDHGFGGNSMFEYSRKVPSTCVSVCMILNTEIVEQGVNHFATCTTVSEEGRNLG